MSNRGVHGFFLAADRDDFVNTPVSCEGSPASAGSGKSCKVAEFAVKSEVLESGPSRMVWSFPTQTRSRLVSGALSDVRLCTYPRPD